MTTWLTLIAIVTFLAVVSYYAPAARYGPGNVRDRDRDRQLAELRAMSGYRSDPLV